MYTSPQVTIGAREKDGNTTEKSFWMNNIPQKRTINGEIGSHNLVDALSDFRKLEAVDSAYLSVSRKNSFPEKYGTILNNGKDKRPFHDCKDAEELCGSELYCFPPLRRPWNPQPDATVVGNNEKHFLPKNAKIHEPICREFNACSTDHYSYLSSCVSHDNSSYNSTENYVEKLQEKKSGSSLSEHYNGASSYTIIEGISSFTPGAPLDGLLTSSQESATLCAQESPENSCPVQSSSKVTTLRGTALLAAPGAPQNQQNKTDTHAKESHSPTCAYEACSKSLCMTSNGWRLPDSCLREPGTKKTLIHGGLEPAIESNEKCLSAQHVNSPKEFREKDYRWLSCEPESKAHCITNGSVPLLETRSKPVAVEVVPTGSSIPRCAVAGVDSIVSDRLNSTEMPKDCCDEKLVFNSENVCTPIEGEKSTYRYTAMNWVESLSAGEKSNWARNAHEKRLKVRSVDYRLPVETGGYCEQLGNCQQEQSNTSPQLSKFLNGDGLNLSLFKVSPCHNDSPTHDRKNCPYYHSLRDRRRFPVFYKAEQCENHFDLETEANGLACLRGDSCDKCHNRQELLYHPDIYKQRFCSSYNYLECHRGKFCAFAHTREEIRCPLFKRHEELAPDMNFFMLRFKTLWCPYGIQHDWHGCLYAHTFQDCRRSPEIGYGSEPCPYWQKDLHSADYAKRCPLSAQCPFSHGSKEQLYHPVYYKTMPCADFKAKRSCPRGRLCAFYHDARERRATHLSLGGNEFYSTELNSGKDRITKGHLKSIPEHQMVFLQANFMCPPLFNLDDFEAFGHASRTSSGVLGISSESNNMLPPQAPIVTSVLGGLRRQKTAPLTSTCKAEEWYGRPKEHGRHSGYVWQSEREGGVGKIAVSQEVSHDDKKNSVTYRSELEWLGARQNEQNEMDNVQQDVSPIVFSSQDRFRLPRSSSWTTEHPDWYARATQALEGRRPSYIQLAQRSEEKTTEGPLRAMVQKQRSTIDPFSISFEWLESNVDETVTSGYPSSGPNGSICTVEAERFSTDVLGTKTLSNIDSQEPSTFEYDASRKSSRSTNRIHDELLENKDRDSPGAYYDGTCKNIKIRFKEVGVNSKAQTRVVQEPSYGGLYANDAACMGGVTGVTDGPKLRDDQYPCFGGSDGFDKLNEYQRRWCDSIWEDYFNERHVARRATLHSVMPFYSTYTKSTDPSSMSSCEKAHPNSMAGISAKGSCDTRQSPLSRSSSPSTPLSAFVDYHKVSHPSYEVGTWDNNNDNSVSTDGETEWSVVPSSSLQGLTLPSRFARGPRGFQTGLDVPVCGLPICDFEKIFRPDKNDPLCKRDSGIAGQLCGFALQPSVDRECCELERLKEKLKERNSQRRHTVAASANSFCCGNADTLLPKSESFKPLMISVNTAPLGWTSREAMCGSRDLDGPRRSHRRMTAPTVVIGGPMGWLDPSSASVDMIAGAASGEILSDIRFSPNEEPSLSDGTWDPKSMTVLESGDESGRRMGSLCQVSSPAHSCSWHSRVSRVCKGLRRMTLSPETSPIRYKSSLSSLESSLHGMSEKS